MGADADAAGGQIGKQRPVTVGVPREIAEGERRVALVPQVVGRLRSRGLTVVVEPGAGLGALIPDEAYTAAGAVLGDPWTTDVILTVTPPTSEQVPRLRPGTVLIGFLAPLTAPGTVADLRAAGVHGFAMEAVPRISRAQSMDALSSQANVAGYRSVLVAAEYLTRYFPMLTTAAGTVKPAKVLVLGAGVAGLQAIATARRLGSQVSGYDVRPEVAEQVRSLGAQWLDLGIEAAGEGGYARELTEDERTEQQKRQQDALAEAAGGFDAAITTALIPGKPAPLLLNAQAVKNMKPGSVIVDLAGEAGGNCELSEAGQTIVREDVTIAAPLNLPATMPDHASQLYARNIQALLELITDEGALKIDPEDEIVKGAMVSGSTN